MISATPLDTLELEDMAWIKGPMPNALVDTKHGGVEVNVTSIDLAVTHVDDHPDGGLAAWGVALGATCAVFATLGMLNTWGVFQTYYQQVLLRGTKPSTVASIGSTQFALVLLPGIAAGRLFDLGYFKRTLFIASVTLVVGIIGTAQCKNYWQLLICQGFLTGLSCGMIFTPIPSILSHWFDKRKYMVIGIVAAGSSLGGTIMPIAVSHLIELIGFKWTMRVVALIVFSLLTIANLTLKRRLDPPKHPGPFFTWSDFRNPAFNVYIIGSAINFLGLYTLLTYIGLSATAVEISPGFSFYLVSIANASAGLGQITAGILSDKIGAINVTAPLTLLCAITTYIWPHATKEGFLIAIAIIYGFCTGAFISLLPAPLVLMDDMRSAGRRTGIVGFVSAFGACSGPPISGAIIQKIGGFQYAGYYAGSCIVVAFIFQCATKYLMLGTLRGKF